MSEMAALSFPQRFNEGFCHQGFATKDSWIASQSVFKTGSFNAGSQGHRLMF
jgi:hypothetical protein